MTLLDAVSFLLPAPLQQSDFRQQTRIEDLRSMEDFPAFVARHVSRNAARQSLDFAKTTSFVALPPYAAQPRVLLPHGVPSAYRALLRPRYLHAGLTKRALVGAVARMPPALLKQVGERIVIGTRSESDVRSALRAIAPEAELGCFLGNAQNSGRSTVFAFSRNAISAIAKIVVEDEGRHRVAHEASMLQSLSRHGHLQGRVPNLLGVPSFHLGAALITDAFDGEPRPPVIDRLASEWLAACVLGDLLKVTASEVVSRLREAARAIPEVRNIVDESCRQLDETRARRVIVHGDFTPWNTTTVNSRVCVFDWEYGTLVGVPEWDELHFIVQVGVIGSSWDSRRLTKEVIDRVARGSKHYDSRASFGNLTVLVLCDLAVKCFNRDQLARSAFFVAVARNVVNSLQNSAG